MRCNMPSGSTSKNRGLAYAACCASEWHAFRLCALLTPQRSKNTTAFEWQLMAWAHACEKSRGTERHEPPGKSSVSANRDAK